MQAIIRLITAIAVISSGLLVMPHGWTPGVTVSANSHAQGRSREDRVYSPEELDKEADIKNLGEVLERFTSRLNCLAVGQINIKLILRKSGRVTDIKVETPTACKAAESSISILRKMKFAPAVKNGRPVSQSVEFTIHNDLRMVPPGTA